MNVPGQKDLVAQILSVKSENILLVGSKGIGKTFLCDKLLEHFSSITKTSLVEGCLYLSKEMGENERLLEREFSNSTTTIIIIIDDLELFCGKAIDFRDPIKFNLKCYISRLFQIHKNDVRIIATTTSETSLEPHILDHFERKFDIIVSQKLQRREIAENLLSSFPILKEEDVLLKFLQMAEEKLGTTPYDLNRVLETLSAEKILRPDHYRMKRLEILEDAFKFRPQLLSEYIHEGELNLTSKDLFGLEDQKEQLRSVMVEPFTHYDLYKKHKLSIPKGVILHGKTGTGKTHLALAIMKESGLNYLQIDSAVLMSKWVGESEKRISEMFSAARQSAPCILFFDRMETLMGKRTDDTSSSGISSRLVSCFLTELDGIKSKGEENFIIVVGATDRLEGLDPAIVRPGRLGVHISLPYRLSERGRRDFLSSKRPNLKITEEEEQIILDKTLDFTGAKFKRLLQEASRSAFRGKRDCIEFGDFGFASP